MLTDVYAAGEDADPRRDRGSGRSGRRARSGRPVTLVKALDDIPAAVARIARPNDLVITLGAGSIGTMPDRILEALQKETPGEVPPKPEAKADEGQGARGEELPPREGAAGLPQGRRRALLRFVSWRAGALAPSPIVVVGYAGYRATTLVLHASGAAGAPHRRSRQRPHLERRSAGDRRRPARARASSPPISAGYRRRLMESPWVADVALRRVLPSTVEVFVSERRPIGPLPPRQRAVPDRRRAAR